MSQPTPILLTTPKSTPPLTPASNPFLTSFTSEVPKTSLNIVPSLIPSLQPSKETHHLIKMQHQTNQSQLYNLISVSQQVMNPKDSQIRTIK